MHERGHRGSVPRWAHGGWGPPRRHPLRGVARIGLVFAVTFGALGAAIATLTRTRWWLGLATAFLGVLILAALARRTMGRFRPIGDMIEAIRRVGDGEIGVRVETPSPGPFVPVAHAFNGMARRLEQEDERRRRLLADLGHELKTPLTVIRGEIEAVVDGVHRPERLIDVLDEVDVMERLLDDLRVLALTEAGALTISPEPTDLATLVGEVVASFSTTIETQHVSVAIDSGERTSSVEVDPLRMHQVLSNLVSNALRQMPEGGVLEVNLDGDEEHVTVAVADTGPGLPPDGIDRIFERFVRSADSGGTGLGLSIARDLVEAHGGSISAADRVEGGAVFTVTLPRGPR